MDLESALAYPKGHLSALVGGTISVVNLTHNTVEIPILLMGFGLPDDHIHGPNERLHFPNSTGVSRPAFGFLLKWARAHRQVTSQYRPSTKGSGRASAALRKGRIA
jgi:hypothetical protein